MSILESYKRLSKEDQRLLNSAFRLGYSGALRDLFKRGIISCSVYEEFDDRKLNISDVLLIHQIEKE